MVWTNAGVISPSRNWQYTNVVEGEFFRLSHNYSDLPTEYFQAELTQIEEGEDGEITTFGHQVIEASPTSEVIQLTKPACFSNRKIAIRQLSRDVDLPPAGRVYSWAIGIEAYDPTEAPPPPPPPPETPIASEVAYVASQSSVLGDTVGTYANLNDSNGNTGAATQSGDSWIKASFPEVVKVSAVTVGGGYLPAFGPVGVEGQLQSSEDDTNWTTHLQITGVTSSGANQFKKFTLPSPVEARYWRIFVNSSYLGATEFKLE